MILHASGSWISSASLRFLRFWSWLPLVLAFLIAFSLGANAEDYTFPDLSNVPVGDGVTATIRTSVTDSSITDGIDYSYNQPSFSYYVDKTTGFPVRLFRSHVVGTLNFRVLFINSTDSPKVVANHVISLALNRVNRQHVHIETYSGLSDFDLGDYRAISNLVVTSYPVSDLVQINNIYTSNSPVLRRSMTSNYGSSWDTMGFNFYMSVQGSPAQTASVLNLNVRYQNFNSVSNGYFFVPANERAVLNYSVRVEFDVIGDNVPFVWRSFSLSATGNLINGISGDTPVHDQGLQQQQQQQFEEFTDSGTNANGSSDAYDGTLSEINNALDQGFGSQLTMLSTDVVNIFDPQGVGNPRLTLPALTWTQDGTTYTIWPERTFGFNSLNNNWGLSFLKTAVNFATVASVYLALHRYLMRKIEWFLAH